MSRKIERISKMPACGEGKGEGKVRRRHKVGQSVSESESYEPDFNQYKKVGLPLDRTRMTVGNWNLDENRSYVKFLQDNRKDFECEESRRRKTVFFRLSRVLRRRTPDQCRSHHQKLQLKYVDVDSIIVSVEAKIRKQVSEQKEGKREYRQRKTEEARPTATGDAGFDQESADQSALVVDVASFAQW